MKNEERRRLKAQLQKEALAFDESWSAPQVATYIMREDTNGDYDHWSKKTIIEYIKEARTEAEPEPEPEDFTLGSEVKDRFYYNELDKRYVIFPCKQFPTPWIITEEECRHIKEAYSKYGDNQTVEECAIAFGFTLGQMQYLLRTVFRHYHASLPFTDADLCDEDDDALVDRLDHLKEARILRKFKAREWKATEADAEIGRSIQKQAEIIAKAVKEGLENSTRVFADVNNPWEFGGLGQLDVLALYDAHIGKQHPDGSYQDFPWHQYEDLLVSTNGDRLELVLGGDFFHTDTATKATTRGTPQDAMLPEHETELGWSVATELVARAKQYYRNVKVRVLYGNHDERSMMHLANGLSALGEHMGFEVEGGHLQVTQFGVTMLAFEHGDGPKPQALKDVLADNYREIWGACKYRHAFTGHLHHIHSRDIGGLVIHQQPTSAKSDRWHTKNGYTTAESAIRMYTYDEHAGLLTIQHRTC